MKPPHSGFSLIEVLVSLLLLSFILLSFDSAEIAAFQKTRDAYYFSIAINQLNSMKERFRVFKNHSELEQEIKLWNLQNQEILPKGKGTVTAQQIKINWGNDACLTEEM